MESPLGDFFAAGFGQRAEVNSAPVEVQGGDAYNCYWPMPFYKFARIEIENQSRKPLNSFYYQVDYVQEPVASGTPYFFAQYRQEFPTRSGRDYRILDAVGRGHYVGTVLSAARGARNGSARETRSSTFTASPRQASGARVLRTMWATPGAWNWAPIRTSACRSSKANGTWSARRTTAYRWHIPDPVRFSKSLRVEIENAGWISKDELADGADEGFVERNDDYATVAFWYQVGQPKRFTRLPSAQERQWPNLDIIVEGKELLKSATSGPGPKKPGLRLQQGYDWTGDGQLFIDNEHGPGAWVEFSFPVEKEELRQLTLRGTWSYDFGVYRILFDGQQVREPIDFYNATVKVKELNLDQRRLSAGKHTLRLECTGQNGLSKGAKLGIDSVRLRQRWNVKRQTPAD